MQMQYGPLNKSLYTQELELLAKCIIYTPKKVEFNLEDDYQNRSLHAEVAGLDIDVSALLKKANFTHIELSEQDSAVYDVKYNNLSNYLYDFPNQYNKNAAALNPGEKAVISDFTGSGYIAINSLLYDNLYSPYGAGEAVGKAVMLSSGLNKIMPSIELNGCESYRGEHSTSYTEMAARYDCVQDGGGITHNNAFMSTSTAKYVGENFAGNCMIIFDNVYGKSISQLSYFPGEQEYLLPPGDILWTSYDYINGKHTFHAQVVAPLNDERDTMSYQEMQEFNTLLDWAKQNGISDDFLTDYNKNKLSSVPASKPLGADDCFSDHDVIMFDTVQTPANNKPAFIENHFDSNFYAQLTNSIASMLDSMHIATMEV